MKSPASTKRLYLIVPQVNSRLWKNYARQLNAIIQSASDGARGPALINQLRGLRSEWEQAATVCNTYMHSFTGVHERATANQKSVVLL